MADETNIPTLPPEASAKELLNQDDDFWMGVVKAPEAEARAEPPPDPNAVPDETQGAAPTKDAAPRTSEPAEPEGEFVPQEGDYSRDESGRWHRPDGSFADKREIEALEAEVAKTQQQVPDPKIEAKRAELSKLLEGFEIKGEDGTPVDLAALPDLKVSYKAAGKVKQDVPLAKVIRLAQMGEYNAERDQEIQQWRAEKPAIENEIQELRKFREEAQALLERMYLDPNDEVYIAARDRFRSENSPEARAQRARQEYEDYQRKIEAARQTEAVQPVLQRISSTVETLVSQHPEVTEDEVLGRFSRLTASLLVNGQIPPARVGEVERLVSGELTQWVQHLHDERASAKAQSRVSAQSELAREREKVALAKRQVARLVAPRGSTGANAPTPKTNKAPDPMRSARDEMKEILGGE